MRSKKVVFMKMMVLAFLTAAFVCPVKTSAQMNGGDGKGNGGGGEIEFANISAQIDEWITDNYEEDKLAAKLLLNSVGVDVGPFYQKYKTALSASVRFSDQSLAIGGVSRVCMNFPAKNAIECNTDQWSKLAGDVKFGIVLHEFLGIAGIEQNTGDFSQYTISKNILYYTRLETIYVPGEKSFEVYRLTRDRTAAVKELPGLKNPRALALGWEHTCVIDDEGVKCWGRNNFGQTDVPKNLKNPRAIAAGAFHSCVLDDEGMKCWGSTIFGEHMVPKNLKNPRSIRLGGNSSCVIDDEGIKCWGAMGDPIGPAFGSGIDIKETAQESVDVAPGMQNFCFITKMKTVRCLGFRQEIRYDLINPKAIFNGSDDVCIIDDEGVKCWTYYKTVDSLEYEQLFPNIPTKFSNPRSVSVGAKFFCVIDDRGLQCFGDKADPLTIIPANLKNPKVVASSKSHSCVIDDEGVKCWGDNQFGQSIPKEIPFPAKRNACGLSGTVEARIEDCSVFKQGWKLVTSTVQGHEVWLDTKSQLLWGDQIEGDANHSKGFFHSEEVEGICSQGNRDENGNLDVMNFALPTMDEFVQAWKNGIESVLPRIAQSFWGISKGSKVDLYRGYNNSIHYIESIAEVGKIRCVSQLESYARL